MPKRRTVRSHRFSSGVFDICVENNDGLTILIKRNKRGEMFVRKDLSPAMTLETIIHESLHAEFPYMSEARVDNAGRNIARLLWRMGYRDR